MFIAMDSRIKGEGTDAAGPTGRKLDAADDVRQIALSAAEDV